MAGAGTVKNSGVAGIYNEGSVFQNFSQCTMSIAHPFATLENDSKENDQLLCAVNDNSKKLASDPILDDFRHERLQAPSFPPDPQMKKYNADDYYKDDGLELWKRIETMSPKFLERIPPVYLILAAVVMGRDQVRDPPATNTELYNRIFSNLEFIENVRNQEISVISVMNKLKILAFNGMKEGKDAFSISDLERSEVSEEDTINFMTKLPGYQDISHCLKKESFKFYFCHPSFLYFLAASSLAETVIKDFSYFVETHFTIERWSPVLRFAAGIIYSTSSFELHRVSDKREKQGFLSRWIFAQLEQTTEWDGRIRLGLYSAIYESDDDDLMKQLSVISVSDTSLSRDEANVVGSLILRSGHLKCLSLCNCGINDDILGIITECLKELNKIPSHHGAPNLVDDLKLSGNNFSEEPVRSFLQLCGINRNIGSLISN